MMSFSVWQALCRNTHHHFNMSESTFSEVLTGLIAEAGVTSKMLASEIGVAIETLNGWRRGDHGVRLSNLVLLCRYFECSLDYLVGKRASDVTPSKFELKNFGEQVRRVMKSKSVTTYALRKETHFTSRNLHDWDNGADPQLGTLIELADYLRCTLDELVGLE